MKLGYLIPLTLETIAKARKLGYDAIEVKAGWIGHSELDELEANRADLQAALRESGISITAVAIYGGTIEVPLADAISYYERAIALARALDCSVVAGFTGRDNSLSVEDNLPVFQEYFDPITRIAEDHGVRVALEPWPGRVSGHGPYRWTNLATTPELWDRLFEMVPSPALGLEYDPSHLMWQGIDVWRALRDYSERIYHVHAKDILIDGDALERAGVHGSGWWRFVVPGLGQVNWPMLFDILKEIGYQGDVSVEHEDRAYMDERWNEGLRLALKTLRPLVESY